jgi:hypothetical protein
MIDYLSYYTWTQIKVKDQHFYCCSTSVGTVPKYHTVGTVLIYHTVETVPKSNIKIAEKGP